MKILEVQNLITEFRLSSGVIRAVDEVNVSLRKGKVLGLVGESGCGKTVTALSILGLVDYPGKITGGRVLYYSVPKEDEPRPFLTKTVHEITASGMEESDQSHKDPVSEGVAEDLLSLKEEALRKVRGKKIAMIFQEPMTALNPVFTVGNQIIEGLLVHERLSKKESQERAIELLRQVGIPDAERRIKDYPHQMSGGMRQRVMIAMALACEPEVLIADEPTTALDVTIQAQILELINQIIEDRKMSMILITHDLGVVAETCDDVAVMYAGKVIEQAPVSLIFNRPKHPYTIGLLESIPTLKKGEGLLKMIPGTVPNLANLPTGCRFIDRCPRAVAACNRKVPELRNRGGGQWVRCINA
jgi:oligopeptide/dipeptide ABC transporter ATP-binding protein